MNGKLKDWSFSRTGESVLTITTRESCKKLWDALGDQEITFSIKRRVIPRSPVSYTHLTLPTICSV